MPALFDQSGKQVNTASSSPLQAGYYYLQGGDRVYYFGDGTYYDPTTQMYGGNVIDRNGTAGVSFNYSTTNTGSNVAMVSSPGVPNTGFGGNAENTWTALGLSGLIAVAGLAYLATRVVVR